MRGVLSTLLVAACGAALAAPRAAASTTASTATTLANGSTATAFSLPTSSAAPKGITAGIDGNIWFTESAGNKVGRISTSGQIAEFALPTPAAAPNAITPGADGNLWFTETSADRIGKVTPSGSVTEYAVPTAGSQPIDITAGPDGNLWFTESAGNKIGRITTAGVIGEFGVPTASSAPTGITAASDGNLYFTEASASKIGRITTAGSIAEQAVSSQGGGAVGPNRVTAGPDSAIWFTEQTIDSVGRTDFQGHVEQIPIPTPNSGPAAITTGVDGALWFAEGATNVIGRLVTPYNNIPLADGSNSPTEYPLSATGGTPDGVAFGSDGNLWFTDTASDTVVRLVAPHAAKEFSTPGPTGDWTMGTTVGNDGAVWFTDFENHIDRMTREGVFTQFAPPSGFATPGLLLTGPDGNIWFEASPIGNAYAPCLFDMTSSGTSTSIACLTNATIVQTALGPDGNVWLATDTEGISPSVGSLTRVTPRGAMTSFQVCTGNYSAMGVIAGPDGNLWYYLGSGQSGAVQEFGKMTTVGTILGTYASPTPAIGVDMTAGPDGNIWFTDGQNGVYRMTTAGVATTFSAPDSFAQALGITAGPDGNMWVAENAVNKVARVTPTGQFTEYPLSAGGQGYTSPQAGVLTVASGHDGYVYFDEYYGQKIGRLPATSTPLNVLVKDNAFIGGSGTVPLGTAVDWSSYGPSQHSVVDASGMGLFNSGALSAWSQYELVFAYAGTYAYKDGMSTSTTPSSFSVPLSVSPASGGTGVPFIVTWAQIAAPSGFVFDVQIEKPGATSFTKFLTGTTTLSVIFKAKTAGTYQFHARTRNTANKKASQWSPTLLLVVS